MTKSLPHKHKDLSLGSQNHVPITLVMMGKEINGTLEPIDQLVCQTVTSRVSERPVPKLRWKGLEG